MLKKQEVIKVIENLWIIFEINNETKHKLKEKISLLSDSEYNSLINILWKYAVQKENNLKNLQASLSNTNLQIEEEIEKVDFKKIEDSFFNNI